MFLLLPFNSLFWCLVNEPNSASYQCFHLVSLCMCVCYRGNMWSCRPPLVAGTSTDAGLSCICICAMCGQILSARYFDIVQVAVTKFCNFFSLWSKWRPSSKMVVVWARGLEVGVLPAPILCYWPTFCRHLLWWELPQEQFWVPYLIIICLSICVCVCQFVVVIASQPCKTQF